MREKIREILREFYTNMQEAQGNKGIRDIFAVEETAIINLEQLIPKWIKTDKELPREFQECLFWVKTKGLNQCFIGDYTENCFESGNYNFDNNVVTHWMPVLMPPKSN